MRKLILIFLVHLISFSWCFSQTEEATKEVIDGKEYYIHTVAKGETLYGISKKYKVKPDVIIINNPESKDGIKPGEKIRIPVPVAETKIPATLPDTTFLTHTVRKGETIYGIAKQYGITEQELIKLNPEVKEGLAVDMKLKIPKKAALIENVVPVIIDKPVENIVSGNIVLVEHRVEKGETIYGISRKYQVTEDTIQLFNKDVLKEGLKPGQTLVIPVQKNMAEAQGWSWYPDLRTLNDEKIKADERRELNRKSVYDVALVLPFMLDRNAPFFENPDKSDIIEPTRQSLDFYHGVLLAVDSLKKFGLSVNLHVHDIYRDTAQLSKFIQSPAFENLDLIIGPTDMVEIVTAAAKEKNIPVVCPFAYSNKILFENPYASKVVTSASVIIGEAGKFIAERYPDENIVLIDGKGKKDEAAVHAYHQLLNELMVSAGKDSITYVKAESLTSKTWIQKLKKEQTNILVVPSNDFSFVSSFMSNLNNTSIKHQYKDYKFVVFGTDEWLRYDDIEAYYKVKFNLHIPSPVYISYTDTLTSIPFIKAFRNKFGTDPDKYAMMGYDIAWYYLSGYLEYGKEFAIRLDEFHGEGVSTGFNYRRLNERSGFLNTNVYILRYSDFTIIKEK